VIEPVEDVLEPERDETQRGLMPARIELDDARVADVLERTLSAGGGQESEHVVGTYAESGERRANGEAGVRVGDRHLHLDVQLGLFPEELGVRRQSPADVTHRTIEGRERAVRRKRNATA